jgi:hypothetical protein
MMAANANQTTQLAPTTLNPKVKKAKDAIDSSNETIATVVRKIGLFCQYPRTVPVIFVRKGSITRGVLSIWTTSSFA